MGFEFSFETLLKHRKRLEDDARKIYLEAQAKVDECLQRIKDLYGQRDQAREDIVRTAAEGGQRTHELQDLDAFIDGLTLMIDRERSRARQLMSVAEEKRDKLVEAARDSKILEKLKERQFRDYQKAAKKREEKAIQDLVTMRFRGKEKP